MTTTSTATPDLATMLTQAERAQAEANAAAARAAAAQAKAQAVAGQIAAERDHRFVAWADARVAESGATEKRLANEVDTARLAFEASVAGGSVDFVATYLTWATAAAGLYHTRNHHNNLRNHLHRRRPDEHPAYDASRQVTDSRTTIPAFGDALARAVAQAAAGRGGDVEDGLQAELQAALRGEATPAPDRRDG